MTVQPQPISAARPLFDEADIGKITEGIARVLRGGRLILGPEAKKLEQDVAERAGTEHAVALASCTAALETVYRHLKVSGRDVVVPTNTFVATAAAVTYGGGEVVFADMSDGGDFGIDVDDALSKITSRTAAVVVVHVAGLLSPRLEELVSECEKRGVPLVEDCAHAHGASLAGKPAGSFGRAGCWSFYPTKILTSGAGGMITTNDPDLAAFARSLRHHGQGASLESVVNFGNNWVLDEVRCVIAQAQYARLDEFVARRLEIAAVYDELLQSDERFGLPKSAPDSSPVYYKYPVLLPNDVDSKVIRAAMGEHKIEVGALYNPPVHLMPVFGERRGTLPVAERLLTRQITLPMHAAMSPEDARRAVDVLLAVMPRT